MNSQSRHSKRMVLCHDVRYLVVVVIVLAFLLLTNWTINNVYLHVAPPQGERHARQQRPPVVIIWNTFFGRAVNPFFTSEVAYMCPRRCVFTRSRSRVNGSAAIVFHARDVNASDIPRRKYEGQIWVLFGLEPPPYTMAPLVALNGLINWTVTYRSDSDIVFPYGYELVKYRRDRNDSRQKLVSGTGKSRMVAWFVSRCDAVSGRMAYVNKLREVVDVDIYGKCGQYSCSPSQSRECYELLSERYYFYLSFENSLCRDYVTEKYYNMFAYDVVPVVMGNANYTAFSPPGSFIDALSFDSPRDLGTYLLKTVNLWKNYSSYFEWRREYRVLSRNHRVACDLCVKIYTDIHVPKVYDDVNKWWYHDAGCWSWKPHLS
ncbi:alpha-(1,3)-fucosyltransferase C-like [Ornithodoros turicata]|uniref:alpha-(1,3)-fucosyltransferase C-like n=1 Tax=Ornithodoros turicata TaxID=34597 RepID=UPI003138BDBC